MKYLAGRYIAFAFEGEEVPPPLRPLSGLPLVILVGLTGVGKSTVLEQLHQSGLAFTLLPNRREITDEIIITTLQQEAGLQPHLVVDRVERFEYTARYRARFPGGMAHALGHIFVRPDRLDSPRLIFDGLRGLEEVQHAAVYLPQARFIVLDAPDMVRLNRLVNRDDSFDTTAVQVSLAQHNLIAALLAVPDIQTVFDQDQLSEIAQYARLADISMDTIVEKVSIIVEERRNYDSAAARAYLASTLPPERLFVIDTSLHPAPAVAEQVARWLEQGS